MFPHNFHISIIFDWRVDDGCVPATVSQTPRLSGFHSWHHTYNVRNFALFARVCCKRNMPNVWFDVTCDDDWNWSACQSDFQLSSMFLSFFPPLSPIFPMFSNFFHLFPASPSFVCLSPIFPAYSRFIFQFSYHFPSLFYLYPIVCCIFSHVFLNFSWCFFHPAGGPGDFDPRHPDGSHLRRLRGGLPGGGSRELRPDQSGWELRVSGAPLSLGGMTDVFSLCQ